MEHRCKSCRSLCSCTGCRPLARYSWHHVAVFLLTFFSYALFHVTRKSFSNIKSVMQDTWSPSNFSKYPNIYPPTVWSSQHFFKTQGDAELFLGYMDSTFLFCYALGLYFSGFIGDRVNLRYLLACGMMLSAVMVFMFGALGPWLRVYSVYYYGVFWGLNGIIQSSGWPAAVAIMGNWFGRNSHGMVFGVWSANASVGNIFGALLVSALLKYGFEYAMMGGSVLLFLGGVVILLCLTEHPSVAGLVCAEELDSIHQHNNTSTHTITDKNVQQSEPLLKNESDAEFTDSDNESTDSDAGITDKEAKNTERDAEITASRLKTIKGGKKAINFCKAFLIPGVLVYSLSYACLKLVNYSLFFWLPFYLHRRYSWASAEESDRLSALYDVGGIIGGVIGGIISDILGRRSPVIVVMLISAVAALFTYQGFGVKPLWNGLLMCVAGIFIGGPANLESSAIVADLGKQMPYIN